jgi:oligoribonuclease (3'-5' exoribonuclease)
MNYKDHRIEVSVHAVNDPKGWRAEISVLYREHGKSVLKTLRMDQTFATPNEAEKAGIEFVQKWIDDGKPT